MFCQNCGNKLKGNIKICSKCGFSNDKTFKPKSKKILFSFFGFTLVCLTSLIVVTYLGYLRLPNDIEKYLQNSKLLPEYLDKDLVKGSIKTTGNEANNLEALIIDERDGNKYRIVKMPDGNWWMAENLRFIQNLSREERILKIEANNFDRFSDFFNVRQVNAIDKDYICKIKKDGNCDINNISYRFNNTLDYKCPKGWRIPSNEDWVKMLNLVEIENKGSQDHNLETDILTELNLKTNQKAGYLLKSTDSGWDYSLDGNRPLDFYGFDVKKAITARYEYNESAQNFGYFYSEDSYSPYWTTSINGDFVTTRVFYDNFNFVGNMKFHKYSFLPVRCIKN
jgi:uncharacterized protein (TIGR02145 family)